MSRKKCPNCGGKIPETLDLCPACMKAAGAGPVEIAAAEELRDIAAVLTTTSRAFNGCKFRNSFITASGNARTSGTRELKNWQSDSSGTGPFQIFAIQNKRLRVIAHFLWYYWYNGSLKKQPFTAPLSA